MGVVVALTFWGSIWGIAGAVLSVPVTCAIKLLLEEVDHSAARKVTELFNAPFGGSSTPEEVLRSEGSHLTSRSLPARLNAGCEPLQPMDTSIEATGSPRSLRASTALGSASSRSLSVETATPNADSD